MKRFSMFGLFLALCAFAAPVQADVCDQPIHLDVELSDMFDPATQDALAYGGTLRYSVFVSGTGDEVVGKASKVTLDFVIKVIVFGRSSTFTRPRTVVKIHSTPRAVQDDRPLVVGEGTEEVCLQVFAHPAGGQCGATDVRAARELGFVEKCINMIVIDP